MAKPPKKPTKKAKENAKSVEQEHRCGFCNAVFRFESGLIAHMCEKRRRYADRDHKHVRFGFRTYCQFYEFNYRGKKQKSFDDFVDSKFYSGFVAFGRYIDEINAINPAAFVDFLLKNGLPLDRWRAPQIYETYVRELNKKESPEVAVERNILLMQQWAVDSGEHWTDFFRKVKTPLATLWIKSGRISPWVLFTASSSQDLFSRMSDEQMQMIQGDIDPKFWQEKLKSNQQAVSEIREILDQAGV